MSWVYAMVSTERAHAIDRELSLTAKRMPVAQRDGRTTAQIRADLFGDLLRGGPVERVKAKVLVTIPLDRLAPDARASVRDGCDRLAIDGDIDHHCAYHGPGRGETDIANLDPLCDPDHALKGTTLLRHRRRADGSVQIRFPSGHRTKNPFAGLRERVSALLTAVAEPPAAPPF